jgi:hypothetical protein
MGIARQKNCSDAKIAVLIAQMEKPRNEAGLRDADQHNRLIMLTSTA